MGGHRFFTKVDEVKKIWHEILGRRLSPPSSAIADLLQSKILLTIHSSPECLVGLGIWESILIVFSYLRWQIFPLSSRGVVRAMGNESLWKAAFQDFFKSYTEKVWGISCSELKAEWAAQRIKDLSLKTVLLSMFFTPKKTIKTLIDQFDYPAGTWHDVESCQGADRRPRRKGAGEYRVVEIHRNHKSIESVMVGCNGHTEIYPRNSFYFQYARYRVHQEARSAASCGSSDRRLKS